MQRTRSDEIATDTGTRMPCDLSRRCVFAIWTGILILAAVARLVSWSEVFAPDRVRFLLDTDPHYHVLRALRIVEQFPTIPWSDPAINYPRGAVILWPPLFDLLIAVAAKILGGSARTVEQVAAWMPVILGLITLLLVGELGKRFGSHRTGLTAAAILALLPANIEYTILGRPDQHAMELVASCWVFLAFLLARRRGANLPRTMVLGLAISIAFWNWQGSGFYLLLLVGFTTVWHITTRGGKQDSHPSRALARAATVGALLLSLSVLLFTEGGLRSTYIMGVTSFHVWLVLITAGFAWILLLLDRTAPSQKSLWHRLIEVSVASLVPLVAAVTVLPGFEDGMERGLSALTASNPWYAFIHEFSPLLFGGTSPVTVEMASMFHHFGLLLIIAPLCVPLLVKRWRRQPELRPELLFLFYWGLLLLTMTFLRVRFNLYAVVPLALWLAVALEELEITIRGHRAVWANRLARGAPALAALLVLLPALSFLRPGTFREAPLVTASIPLLKWLREAAAAVPGREGVLSPWSLGHSVRYFARKPVVTTPFGTDGGPEAMEDSARFFLASNPDAAELLLEHRRIGFLLLMAPEDEVLTLYPFVGSAIPGPVRFVPDRVRGGEILVSNAFSSLIVSRLYFQDGSGASQVRLPGLGGYRLLFETPPTAGQSGSPDLQMKLFGVVPGASVVVAHAQPQSLVLATIAAVTNQLRPFLWTTVAQSDALGRATLRIPYANGNNGLVRALTCRISDGARSAQIVLLERQVVEGETLVVDLMTSGKLSPPAP